MNPDPQDAEPEAESEEPLESPFLNIPLEQPDFPPAPPRYRRRKFLAALAITSLSAAGYRPLRDQFNWKKLAEGSSHWRDRLQNRLEKEWNEFREEFLTKSPPPTPRTLEAEKEYSEFLASIPLRYIRPEEVIRPHRNIREGVPNELPPRSYWKRIEVTLKVADEIRHRLGKPLYCINSAYRSPAYNAACPGTATWSYHMRNQALDLMFTGGSADAAEVAMKLREEKFFKGGIGTYPNFIHIDTRGSNATWEA